ncbi:MAG: sulfotransferase domain-containing protein [Thermoplasmata archaeon]|nr:sulfotransferase domain-containing protein [Thermoplasmata archaeon]
MSIEKGILPNFLCVGAQKSGTTTLFNLLKQHPDIFLPKCKEIHFFDIDEHYNKGLKWYKKFFLDWKGEKAIGEITPSYMYFEKVPKRIFYTLGNNIKLIFILRNPIDRAYSHYWMSYRRGYEKESFERAIILESERLKKGIFEQFHFSYINRGFYAKQIKRYFKYFPQNNCMFIIFEEFIKCPGKIFREICQFLNISSDFIPPKLNIKSNPTMKPISKTLVDLMNNSKIIRSLGKLIIPYKPFRKYIRTKIYEWNLKPFNPPKISKHLRYQLIKIFYPDIKELEKLINKDLTLWLEENLS